MTWHVTQACAERPGREGDRNTIADSHGMRQGHAFEARLYAESPARGFLPSPGTLRRWRPPPAAAAFAWDADVRVDSGVQEGDAVRPALAAWCTVVVPASLQLWLPSSQRSVC